MFITKEQLAEYSTVVNEDGATLPEQFCSAACDIVSDYLGYDPEEKEYTQVLDGTGTKQIALKAKPITNITSVKINNVEVPSSCFVVEENYLLRTDGEIFHHGNYNVVVNYTAGYSSSGTAMPGIITITALRIAAILQGEENGNVGITSKSFGESGTRTFYKTKFDDYLLPIDRYRIY